MYKYVKSIQETAGAGMPGIKVQVPTPFGVKTLELDMLTKNEVEIFDVEFANIVNTELTGRKMMSMYETNTAFILSMMQTAKGYFKGRPFAGENARVNEFGFSLIRPEHVGFSTWDGENTGTGWGDWCGSASVQRTLGEEALVVVLGLINYDPSPKTSAVRATIGNTTFPAWYMEQSQRLPGTLQMKELANKVYIGPEVSFNVRKKRDSIGFDSLALLGLTYAQGSELSKESPTPTTPTTNTVPVV